MPNNVTLDNYKLKIGTFKSGTPQENYSDPRQHFQGIHWYQNHHYGWENHFTLDLSLWETSKIFEIPIDKNISTVAKHPPTIHKVLTKSSLNLIQYPKIK